MKLDVDTPALTVTNMVTTLEAAKAHIEKTERQLTGGINTSILCKIRMSIARGKRLKDKLEERHIPCPNTIL